LSSITDDAIIAQWNNEGKKYKTLYHSIISIILRYNYIRYRTF